MNITQKDIERFENKRYEKEDGHYGWSGGKLSSGYGHFWFNGRTVKAHRFAWMMYHNREIPEGMVIMHTCDQTDCTRKECLILGTQLENIQDRDRKGRRVPLCGKDHGNARRTEEQVRFILDSPLSSRELAAITGISQSTVCNIRAGRLWAHMQ